MVYPSSDSELEDSVSTMAIPAPENSLRIQLETQLAQLDTYKDVQITPIKLRTRGACLRRCWELLGEVEKKALKRINDTADPQARADLRKDWLKYFQDNEAKIMEVQINQDELESPQQVSTAVMNQAVFEQKKALLKAKNDQVDGGLVGLQRELEALDKDEVLSATRYQHYAKMLDRFHDVITTDMEALCNEMIHLKPEDAATTSKTYADYQTKLMDSFNERTMLLATFKLPDTNIATSTPNSSILANPRIQSETVRKSR